MIDPKDPKILQIASAEPENISADAQPGKPDRNKPNRHKRETREEKLAKQLRENLLQRKRQSKARNTRPRTFKKSAD